MNILLPYTNLLLEVNRLLKVKLIPSRPQYEGEIGRAFYNIIKHQNNGFLDKRDFELLRMTYLVNNLQVIEKYSPEMLRAFAKKLTDNKEFHGARFEVAIASTLIKKALQPIKQESPDFFIKDHSAYIECTIARLGDRKKGDLSYKMKSAIAKKSAKKYCTPSTILALDITNLLHASSIADKSSILQDNMSWTEKLREVAIDSLNTSNFGSLLLFHSSMDGQHKSLEERRFGLFHKRVDNGLISSNLKSFLDLFYPPKFEIQRDFMLGSSL